MMYDYLIVGAGLFGATFAYKATQKGKKCLVIDKRNHIGGNVYTEEIEDINVHRYGAHIFHTSDKEIWDFVNGFTKFNSYVNSPIANFHGEKYNLPFNMNTFEQMWGVTTKEDAEKIINEQKKEIIGEPKNLEEQAISLVGRDIYEKLIKGYTEKQWGRKCSDLPSFIIRRLPVRFTYDNNYFNDKYQGIPIGGYTKIIKKMLEGCDIKLGVDFCKQREKYEHISKKIIFTGAIDEYFDYCFGPLEYRTVSFETEVLDKPDFQGVAVMNFTDSDTPYTRIIEHKHFEFGKQEKTVISREYSKEWSLGDEPYYPVADDKNNALYEKYAELAKKDDNLIFGGRLGQYRYFDMHIVIRNALDLAEKELQ